MSKFTAFHRGTKWLHAINPQNELFPTRKKEGSWRQSTLGSNLLMLSGLPLSRQLVFLRTSYELATGFTDALEVFHSSVTTVDSTPFLKHHQFTLRKTGFLCQSVWELNWSSESPRAQGSWLHSEGTQSSEEQERVWKDLGTRAGVTSPHPWILIGTWANVWTCSLIRDR